jgi:hypothetical protein
MIDKYIIINIDMYKQHKLCIYKLQHLLYNMSQLQNIHFLPTIRIRIHGFPEALKNMDMQ